MKSTAPLHLITTPAPSTAELVATALQLRDSAEQALRTAEALLTRLGPIYIAEKYPEAKEFMRPSIERLRAELKR